MQKILSCLCLYYYDIANVPLLASVIAHATGFYTGYTAFLAQVPVAEIYRAAAWSLEYNAVAQLSRNK